MARLLVLVLVLMLGGCGSPDGQPASTAKGGASVSEAEELSARLTQMVQDTIDAVGLSGLEMVERRGFRGCSAPLRPGEEYESWGITFPTVREAEGRAVMRRVVEFWEREAPGWAREGFEVRADDAPEKSTPSVFLGIDGFSLSASYWVGGGPEAFRLGGGAPCVKRP